MKVAGLAILKATRTAASGPYESSNCPQMAF